MTSTVPHQALYRRWRAQTFSQIVGQEAVVETLRNAVRTDRVAHAMLFVGPRGTGKTSLARILAKAVNCTDLRDGDPCDACDACVAIREGTTLDVLEIDAASNRGINEVRDLRDRLAYPPGHLKRKVYILDEAHQITKDAWNALLKSLEEPPDFVVFMFASTEPSGFPPAILSRLQRYDVRRLTVPEIEGKLVRILEADGRTADPDALALIARLAAGGMRDAESILDQLLGSSAETITEAEVRELLGLADAAAVEGFIDALRTGDVAAGVGILDRLDERGRDPRALLDQVVDAIRGRLVAASTGPEGPELAEVARRLVAIDPDRAGIGGLRLQLELALFSSAGRVGQATAVAAATAIATPAVEPPGPDSATPTRTTESPTDDGVRPTGATVRPTPPSRIVGSAAKPAPPEPRALETPSATSPAPVAQETQPPTAAASPALDPPAATSPADPSPAAVPDQPMPAPAAALAQPSPIDGMSPAPPPPAAPRDLSLDGLSAAWPSVVALLSRQPAVKQLILTCRPVALDGAIVTLGFPEEQGFLRDIAERKRSAIEAGIGEIIGREVTVRCVVANIEVAPLEDASDLVAEARRIFGEDLVDVGEVS
ncbi:MAG TPA: DNA polymerase III subunit gamma/tau [Candidatus Saccharimonadales bacterium]|nr:DNA polymerase III subunit gamma/tau [Candidatus Saccharimonadales bacterium]